MKVKKLEDWAEYGQKPVIWPFMVIIGGLLSVMIFYLHEQYYLMLHRSDQLEQNILLLKNRANHDQKNHISNQSISSFSLISNQHQSVPAECASLLHHFSSKENKINDQNKRSWSLIYRGNFFELMRCFEAQTQQLIVSKFEMHQIVEQDPSVIELILEGDFSFNESVKNSESVVKDERIYPGIKEDVFFPSQFESFFEIKRFNNKKDDSNNMNELKNKAASSILSWQWQGIIEAEGLYWALFSDGKEIHRLGVGDEWLQMGKIVKINEGEMWWKDRQGQLKKIVLK